MRKRRICVKCDAPACFERCDASRQTLCLLHMYATSEKARWRLVDESAVEKQKEAVEEAWQKSYDAIARHLSAAAAHQLTRIETSDDPLATLLKVPDESTLKRATAKDPRKKKSRKPIEVEVAEDPSYRHKRTRPSVMWATNEDERVTTTTEESSFGRERGEACPSCGSADTVVDESFGGNNVHAHKVEIWGSKDAPDSIVRTVCQSCNHAWTDVR